ncbi:hypothetical protein M3Y94_00910200 [Aphelenchoides besseyi]|nr:hypothetical protein M3Y94_00910200 [Aphelenchoides besseyi]
MEVQRQVTEPHTPLCVLFRHSAAMFLDGLDPFQIAKIAVINKAHYLWIKQYFDENVGCLNIFVNGNKFCVSRKPCDLSNYSCTHRLVRNIDNFNLLIKMGLVTIRSVYIQSHAKPTCKPLSMHAVQKLLTPLCQVAYLYIDVNRERPYVKMIYDLLERNLDTIQGFYVCRSDEDNSEFNFLRYLNITRFGKADFPLHSFVKTKKEEQEEDGTGWRQPIAELEYERNSRVRQ